MKLTLCNSKLFYLRETQARLTSHFFPSLSLSVDSMNLLQVFEQKAI